jgi:hypothetical protein
MNATGLRIVLISGLALLISGVGVGTWWLQGVLAERVASTDRAKTDADLAQLDLEKLRRLQIQLDQQKDTIERADQIAATASNYQYQDQVVGDLENYAHRHQVEIASFDFSGASSPGASTNSPAGTTRTPFTVSLRGPLSFDKVMDFLRDIENNLTKLQVASLSLTPNADDTKLVNNPSLSLVVYLKK